MINEHKSFINRLRSSNLRPTKQRLAICKVLFDRVDTFHFTIDDLKKKIEKYTQDKISLATLYNTVHALKINGFLREISLQGNKTFFDTNATNHHHFYDKDSGKLFDISNEDIFVSKFPSAPKGKKIRDIEVTISVANDNQIQKK